MEQTLEFLGTPALGFYPPDGRVRFAPPPFLDEDAVRLAIIAKLIWRSARHDALNAAPLAHEDWNL